MNTSHRLAAAQRTCHLSLLALFVGGFITARGGLEDFNFTPPGAQVCVAPAHDFNSIFERIGVTALRISNPALTGNGVNVAVVEAAEGCPNMPIEGKFEINPAYVNRPVSSSPWNWIGGRFSMRNYFPNDVGTESTHADTVGKIFFGRVSTPAEGVAPDVSLVNNYYVNAFFQGYIGIGQALLNNELIVNQSFGLGREQDVLVDNYWDVYVANSSHPPTIASAVGDATGPNYGRPASPATAYNVIAVAAMGPNADTIPGPTFYDGLQRSKPDITAPGEATSY